VAIGDHRALCSEERDHRLGRGEAWITYEVDAEGDNCEYHQNNQNIGALPVKQNFVVNEVTGERLDRELMR
jgi:hypothetical protein